MIKQTSGVQGPDINLLVKKLPDEKISKKFIEEVIRFKTRNKCTDADTGWLNKLIFSVNAEHFKRFQTDAVIDLPSFVWAGKSEFTLNVQKIINEPPDMLIWWD